MNGRLCSLSPCCDRGCGCWWYTDVGVIDNRSIDDAHLPKRNPIEETSTRQTTAQRAETLLLPTNNNSSSNLFFLGGSVSSRESNELRGELVSLVLLPLLLEEDSDEDEVDSDLVLLSVVKISIADLIRFDSIRFDSIRLLFCDIM